MYCFEVGKASVDYGFRTSNHQLLNEKIVAGIQRILPVRALDGTINLTSQHVL